MYLYRMVCICIGCCVCGAYVLGLYVSVLRWYVWCIPFFSNKSRTFNNSCLRIGRSLPMLVIVNSNTLNRRAQCDDTLPI